MAYIGRRAIEKEIRKAIREFTEEHGEKPEAICLHPDDADKLFPEGEYKGIGIIRHLGVKQGEVKVI